MMLAARNRSAAEASQKVGRFSVKRRKEKKAKPEAGYTVMIRVVLTCSAFGGSIYPTRAAKYHFNSVMIRGQVVSLVYKLPFYA